MVEICSKEDHEVYFESFEDFPKNQRPKNPYLYFKNNQDYAILKKQAEMISPDAVLYLRDDYENPEYYNNFMNFLDLSVLFHSKFVYLSNLETVDRQCEIADEYAEIRPVTPRGEMAAQCEYRIKMKHDSYGLAYNILRADRVYGRSTEKDNLLVEVEDKIDKASGRISLPLDYLLYPIHCDDLAYGIKLAMESCHKNEIYHICGEEGIYVSELYEKIAEKMKQKIVITVLEKNKAIIGSSKMQEQLEWIRFHVFDQTLEQFRPAILPESKKEQRKQVKKKHKNIRWLLETGILFLIFVLADLLLHALPIGKYFDLMPVFIIIVALRYHVAETYAAILLSVFYQLITQGSALADKAGYFAFSNEISHIITYVVLGNIVALFMDRFRNRFAEVDFKNRQLSRDKEELLDINAKLILVKNEYEKRLLSTRYSFSGLYSVLNRISVLDPEKIMVELMEVISDVLETKTVSIYTVSRNYTRMMVSLNEASVYIGKSWEPGTQAPEMYRVLKKGEIYQGNTFHGEPALAAPILRDGELIAFVVINTMKFENMSMYYINLLKVLVIMSGDTLYRANEYYAETRKNHYMENTDIAYYPWFRKKVQYEKEKSEHHFSSYIIARSIRKENVKEAYERLSPDFRSTDSFGLDKEGHLCLLIRNVSEGDRYIIENKINSKGIGMEIVDDID